MKQAPYDAGWPAAYQDEALSIAAALGPELVAIEHVGSTAVAGMPAKPIIDILAAVAAWEHLDVHVAALHAIGYVYTPHSETDDPGRRVFRKPSDLTLDRTHHLHVTQFGSPYWRRIIRFRDHLRADPEAAERYAELKRQLAEAFELDPDQYTSGKAHFVRLIDGSGREHDT